MIPRLLDKCPPFLETESIIFILLLNITVLFLYFDFYKFVEEAEEENNTEKEPEVVKVAEGETEGEIPTGKKIKKKTLNKAFLMHKLCLKKNSLLLKKKHHYY